jgi:WD40 repeat protein
MASTTAHQQTPHDDNAAEEAYLDPNDIAAEVEDDGDVPMDDDEEENVEISDEMGEIVWEDNSIQQFTEHKGKSVFAVATHPTQPIAVSGGEDDMGYIWDIQTGELITKLTGHTDSVSSVGFSHDGDLVATGGMDGRVRFWRRLLKDESYKTWEFLTELQGPDEVIWLKWHPRGNVVLVAGNDATLWLWQLPSGNTMQVFAGHEGPIHCGDFTPDGKLIVTADESGALIVWDPRSPTPHLKLTASDGRFALDGGITSLAVNPSATVAVVGGASGGVRVVNLTKGEVIGALDGHGEDQSVEAVTFVQFGAKTGPGAVVTGGTDGKVCVWDLSTMKLRSTMEHGDAVTSITRHPAPSDHLITSASEDKTLKTWDTRSGSLLREHKGHTGSVLGVSVVAGGETIVSAGDDGVCLVFPTQ